MTPFPPEPGCTEATKPADPSPSAPESGQDDSGALRARSGWDDAQALAALLEPKAFDLTQPAMWSWRRDTQARALAVASKVILLGYRRVVPDDDTVERVAEALRRREAVRFAERERERGGNAWLTPWRELPEHTQDWYRDQVRDVLAAVRAIRKAAQ